jgi:GNAT superfamily N-acetyltransferase
MTIRPYAETDEAAVLDLWRQCQLTVPQNDPVRDIQLKLQINPEWFLVGENDGQVVASCMAGYEGHRGWINYLAVLPSHQRTGIAREIMAAAERLLRAAGCPKINLQVRSTNLAVIAFYERLGFSVDPVTSMGKRLENTLVPDEMPPLLFTKAGSPHRENDGPSTKIPFPRELEMASQYRQHLGPRFESAGIRIQFHRNQPPGIHFKVDAAEEYRPSILKGIEDGLQLRFPEFAASGSVWITGVTEHPIDSSPRAFYRAARLVIEQAFSFHNLEESTPR